MQLQGTRGQPNLTTSYPFGGSITTGGTPQLVLPRLYNRTYLLIQNTSGSNLTVGVGPARATATVSGGSVTSVAVTNAGVGYSVAPYVSFLGGGTASADTDAAHLGGSTGGLGWPNPARRASAHCVMIGSAPNMTISSIVMDDIGAGYTGTPFVYINNAPTDPYGAFAPSATTGIQLLPGGSWVQECTTVITDQISIFGASTGQTFECYVVRG